MCANFHDVDKYNYLKKEKIRTKTGAFWTKCPGARIHSEIDTLPLSCFHSKKAPRFIHNRLLDQRLRLIKVILSKNCYKYIIQEQLDQHD